jgi:hypothetical protein
VKPKWRNVNLRYIINLLVDLVLLLSILGHLPRPQISHISLFVLSRNLFDNYRTAGPNTGGEVRDISSSSRKPTTAKGAKGANGAPAKRTIESKGISSGIGSDLVGGLNGIASLGLSSSSTSSSHHLPSSTAVPTPTTAPRIATPFGTGPTPLAAATAGMSLPHLVPGSSAAKRAVDGRGARGGLLGVQRLVLPANDNAPAAPLNDVLASATPTPSSSSSSRGNGESKSVGIPRGSGPSGRSTMSAPPAAGASGPAGGGREYRLSDVILNKYDASRQEKARKRVDQMEGIDDEPQPNDDEKQNIGKVTTKPPTKPTKKKSPINDDDLDEGEDLSEHDDDDDEDEENKNAAVEVGSDEELSEDDEADETARLYANAVRPHL